MKKTLLVLAAWPLIASSTESPCRYQHEIIGRYTKEISRVENLRKEVFADSSGNRRCLVELDAWIDGVKYSTEGYFIFGPDLSENTACGQAEQRAKENLIRRVSPEILTADTRMVCNNQTAAQTQAHQPQPYSEQYRVPGLILNQPFYPIPPQTVRFEANPNLVNRQTQPRPRSTQPTIQPYLGR